MRRKDREITDPLQISKIIDACDCCRIGFQAQDGVYIVPLNFGFLTEEEQRIFYFHGAKSGRKIDLLKNSPDVGFELDTNHKVKESDKACEYSFRFSSVIGSGTASIVEDVAEKTMALGLIMRHYSGRDGWTFSDREAEGVAVIKLEVKELSCKEHQL